MPESVRCVIPHLCVLHLDLPEVPEITLVAHLQPWDTAETGSASIANMCSWRLARPSLMAEAVLVNPCLAELASLLNSSSDCHRS